MQMLTIHQMREILGNEAGIYAEIIEKILQDVDGVEYTFEAEGEFGKRKPPERNQVYWTEILYRCHWVASSAIIRTNQWLHGFCIAYMQSNLLAAAACARGLIESSGDAEYSLNVVPLTLANGYEMIKASVEGNLKTIHVNPELERRLIHFTHARKQKTGEAIPEEQVARQVSDYLRRFDTIEPKVTELYRLLCDLSHPGASSVLSYIECVTSDAKIVRISLNEETLCLADLRDNLTEVIEDILDYGLKYAIVTLRIINEFTVNSIHTPATLGINMSNDPLWKKIAHAMNKGLV